MTDNKITCIICGREYLYERKSGHTKEKCNSCVVNPRKKIIKLKAIEYKGGKCIICGYNKCTRALTFHHLIPEEKEFGLSNWASAIKWERIKLELDKCVLLCQNCHSEVHDGMTKLPEI